jgi:hypothetical protein
VDAFEKTPTDFKVLCKKKRNKTMANERPQRETLYPEKNSPNFPKQNADS